MSPGSTGRVRTILVNLFFLPSNRGEGRAWIHPTARGQPRELLAFLAPVEVSLLLNVSLELLRILRGCRRMRAAIVGRVRTGLKMPLETLTCLDSR